MSAADVQGRQWFQEKVKAAGLEFRQDGAGNLSAVLTADAPQAPTLLAGSHLDTVRNGGRYDGALGVLSALEAIQTIKEAGLDLSVHLEAISFTDEEGSILGLFGSQALTGQLTAGHLEKPRGGLPALQAGMKRLGLTNKSILSAQRPPGSLCGFIEIHVEQGTRLETAGLDVGIVTGIVGIRSAWLRFGGQAAHAGTQPMVDRADALWGATEFIQQARTLVMEKFSPGVMNCGLLDVSPSAFNIVPAEVNLALEFRHGTEAQLDEMASALFGLAEEMAQKYRLTLEIDQADHCQAAPSSEKVMIAIEQAVADLGLKGQRLMSFAGHDAQSLSTITPTAMIFVPSVKGVSHAPTELTYEQDIINGANVLLGALLKLVY